uniref:Uncharacterized protein n=1 Tax=Hyaloperonospora arabidopsidis (strain Emoy2) TaxID=559515 RepID=M4BN13_HYAAE
MVSNLYNLIEGSIRRVLSVLSETASEARVIYEQSLSPTDWDFKQLTELRSSDENHRTCYSHALPTLKEARRQKKCHETQAGAADAHPANRFTVRPVCKEVNTKAFTQLVSARYPAEDGEDRMWYRRTLLHLKNKRQRQLSHYDRADSFCSTISSVD